MKKLLILTALAAVTGASVGCTCCGLGRRADYCAPYEPCETCTPGCDTCNGGGVGPVMSAPVGGTVITTPSPTYVPGPASTTTRYLPR
jgi:hypothetical protein